MAKRELENFVEKTKQLKREPPSRKEYDGMLKSAQRALTDAQNESIETDSQFDLAVEAAHKFALATLRREGYRSENRVTVFQALVHTIALNSADLQIFLKAHNERNLAAYQGRVDIDEKLLTELIAATKRLSAAVAKLSPPAA
ncbi:MAG: hypothetical protein ACJ8F3_21760 [Xanthobacteraceae bacterium]